MKLNKNILLFIIPAFLIIHFDWKVFFALFHNQIVSGNDLHHFYAWRVFITKSLFSGNIPLWGPYTFAGYPFLASLQPAIFHPATILHMLLPINSAYDAEFIMIMAGMSFFMWLWLKQFSLSRFSILAGMIIFTFCGFTAYRISVGHISHLRAAVWLPLIFYFVQKLIAEKDRLKILFFSLLCGWAIGFQITAGFPQFVIYTFLSILLYLFSLKFLTRSISYKKISYIIIFIYCSAALSLIVQILPTLEGFKFSAINRSYEYSTFLSMPVNLLITFFTPNFFGNLLTGSNFKATYGYYWETQNYFSLLGLVLTAIALYSLKNKTYKKNRNLIIAMATISAFSLLVALGEYTPFYAFLYYIVPGIKGTRVPGRALGILSFTIATLSACGLSIIEYYLKDKFKLKKLAYFSIITAIPLIIYSDLYINNSGFIKITPDPVPAVSRKILAKIKELKNQEEPLWRIDSKSLQNYGFIYEIENIRGANTFSLKYFNDLVRSISPDVLRKLLNVKYLVLKFPPKKILTAADFDNSLISNCNYLTEGKYRISADLNITDSQNKTNIATFSVLGCNDKIITEKEVGRSFNISINLKQNSALKFAFCGLAQNNINFTINRLAIEPIEPDAANIVYRDPDSGSFVIKNEDYLPRISFIPFVFVCQPEKIIDIINSDSFNLRQVAIIERKLPDRFNNIVVNQPLNIPDNIQATIEIIAITAEKLIFEADCPKKGMILISQIYYPGWKVNIDGKHGEIYKADYALTGIPIDQGNHKIEFYYSPSYWNFALSVALFMAIFTTVVFILILLKRYGK